MFDFTDKGAVWFIQANSIHFLTPWLKGKGQKMRPFVCDWISAGTYQNNHTRTALGAMKMDLELIWTYLRTGSIFHGAIFTGSLAAALFFWKITHPGKNGQVFVQID
jgi:hypothetical protein